MTTLPCFHLAPFDVAASGELDIISCPSSKDIKQDSHIQNRITDPFPKCVWVGGCVSECVHANAHVCVCKVRACVLVRMRVCVCARICTCFKVCVSACTCVKVCVCECIHVCMHLC